MRILDNEMSVTLLIPAGTALIVRTVYCDGFHQVKVSVPGLDPVYFGAYDLEAEAFKEKERFIDAYLNELKYFVFQ